jgi:hypothetical protein
MPGTGDSRVDLSVHTEVLVHADLQKIRLIATPCDGLPVYVALRRRHIERTVPADRPSASSSNSC